MTSELYSSRVLLREAHASPSSNMVETSEQLAAGSAIVAAVAVLQARLEQVEARMDAEFQQQGKQGQAIAVLARGNLLICAGQIVDTAMGQPFAETHTAVSRDDPAVIDLAKIAGKDAGTFAAALSGVLNRRNNSAAHASSCSMLDEQVNLISNCITPQLRNNHKWECWLVENYKKVKDTFPERFQTEPPA